MRLFRPCQECRDSWHRPRQCAWPQARRPMASARPSREHRRRHTRGHGTSIGGVTVLRPRGAVIAARRLRQCSRRLWRHAPHRLRAIRKVRPGRPHRRSRRRRRRGAAAQPSSPPSTGAFRLLPASGRGHLAPGSDPGALPGDVLIADEDNNRLLLVDPQGRIRWQFPGPGDLPRGQVFGPPDDAFVSPDGRAVIATQEMYDTVSVINIATGQHHPPLRSPGRTRVGPGLLQPSRRRDAASRR